MSDQMYNLELDIDYNFLETEVGDWAKRFNVIPKMIVEVGPAGGNPIYSFTGSFDNLYHMYTDTDGFGPHTIQEFKRIFNRSLVK